MNMNKNDLTAKLTLFTVCFMADSFIGWVYETVITSIAWGRFADRGVLHIPICPIYGIFAAAAAPLFSRHKGYGFVFAVSAAAATVMELASSFLLEAILHTQLWDYSGRACNFEGRISLFSSLIFGILGVIFIKGTHPLIARFMDKLTLKKRILFASVLAVPVLADAAVCIILP